MKNCICKPMPFAWIGATALIGCILLHGCSALNPMAGPSDESPLNPPVPANDSLLPLVSGNAWHYTYRVYDSAGVQNSSDEDLTLSIPGVWGGGLDSVLTRLYYGNWDNAFSSFSAHFYEYAWGEGTSGSLIAYLTPAGRPSGYYLMGIYQGMTTQLFDSAQLWLAYPTTTGFTYSYTTGASGDTAAIHAMRVVSVKEPYYFPHGNGAGSGVSFVDCQLYQETYRDTVSYYWFSKPIGCIAYQRLYGGIIRKSFILNDYTVRM
jgi:hypothetical protein